MPGSFTEARKRQMARLQGAKPPTARALYGPAASVLSVYSRALASESPSAAAFRYQSIASAGSDLRPTTPN